MKFFYDTEFLEDGKTIDLISIGIVAEDGRELYLVNEAIANDDKLYDRIRKNDWLMDNVVPHLPLRPRDGFRRRGEFGGGFWLNQHDNRVVPRRYIRNAVREFLTEDMSGVELWARYAAYDFVALVQLFGRLIDLPGDMPMRTNDLEQEIARRGLSEEHLPQQSDGLHNALADARHLKVMYDHVAGGAS